MSFQICVHLSFFFTSYFPFIFSLSLCTRLCRRPLPPRLSCVWQCSSSGQPGRGGSLQKNTAGGWQGGRKRNGLQEGPLVVVGCGEANAHWVALQSAENWKFTANTWRQKVGRTQPEIGILQWEYGVGIWCQYDENMDPSSVIWTLQAEIFHSASTANLDAVSDSVHTFMTTVDHLLLDQPEGKCISGTVCSLFCVLEPQLQTTFSKFNTKSIKFRPGHLQGPLWMCGTVVCRTVVEIWLLVLSSTASTAQ